MKDSIEKRKYFRVYLDTPLCADVTISEMNGIKVTTGSAKACINNIGPVGLLFASHLELPNREDIILEFTVTLQGCEEKLYGKIVRKEKVAANIFRYGVEFIGDKRVIERYIRLFNELDVQIHRKHFKAGCSFCMKRNYMQCLKNKSVQTR